MFFRVMVSILSLSSLSGCAQFASHTFSKVSPDNLLKPSVNSEIELKEEFVAYQGLGLLKTPFVYRLKPGVYVSEYEDKEGVFYRGPENALLKAPVIYEDKTNRENGGIWVTKCGNTKTQFKVDIYFYIRTNGSNEIPYTQYQSNPSGVLTQSDVIGSAIAYAIIGAIGTPDDSGKIQSTFFAHAAKDGGREDLEKVVLPQIKPCS